MCDLILEKDLDLAASDSFFCDYTHIQLPNNQTLSMTRIDVGLMGVCSNCHGHKNYHKKQQKIGLNLNSKHETRLRQKYKG
jgi:hypothetical protein